MANMHGLAFSEITDDTLHREAISEMTEVEARDPESLRTQAIVASSGRDGKLQVSS